MSFSHNKQIVRLSDRDPDHLNEMEERLVTRLKMGVNRQYSPDFETRVAILLIRLWTMIIISLLKQLSI